MDDLSETIGENAMDEQIESHGVFPTGTPINNITVNPGTVICENENCREFGHIRVVPLFKKHETYSGKDLHLYNPLEIVCECGIEPRKFGFFVEVDKIYEHVERLRKKNK